MKNKNGLMMVVGIVLVAALVLAACAPSPEPTPTPTPTPEKTKLVWQHQMGLTGAYASVMKVCAVATEELVKWANKKNYIPGVELEALIYDDASDAAKAVAAFERGMSQKPAPILITTESTAANLALKEIIDREKEVPVMGGGPNPKAQTPGSWMFAEQGRYEGCTVAFIDYCIANDVVQGQPKFAFVTWDNAFGRCFVADATIDYMESKGWEYAGAVYITPNATDTSAQAMQLKDWGVNVTFGGIYPNDGSVIMKDCDRIGLTGKIAWGNPHSNDPGQMMQLAGEICEGSYYCQFAPFRDCGDWPIEIEDTFNETGLGSAAEMLYGWFWSRSRLCAEIIRVAAEKVGPENVTGKDVYEAIRSIDDFYGTWTCPVNFTEDNIGLHHVKMYQIKGQRIVSVSDKLWDTPNLWQ